MGQLGRHGSAGRSCTLAFVIVVGFGWITQQSMNDRVVNYGTTPQLFSAP
jgi:hypothetical protein